MRVLLISSNPSDTDRLAIDREVRAIQREIHGNGVKLETRWAAEPLDLLRELRRIKPAIVQFSGHGSGDGLWFQDHDGKAKLITTAALVETVGAAGSSVRLVVMGSCYSDAHAGALLKHVDAVIGMEGLLEDNAARGFSRELYRSLAGGASIGEAFSRACAAPEMIPELETCWPRLRVGA